MKIPREYRFEQNPIEERIIKEFIEDWANSPGRFDKGLYNFTDVALAKDMEKERNYLNKREEMIILNTIQWLGSPVGRYFLHKCGFTHEEDE